MAKKSYEKVNHPKHYNQHPSGVECIAIIETMPHNIGAAIKYLWRAGLKPGESSIEDLKKSSWYVQREILRAGNGVPKYVLEALKKLPARKSRKSKAKKKVSK